MLPELKTNDILIDRKAREWIVHVVTGKRKRETGFIESLYRLERLGIIGNQQWTLDELNAQGMTLKGTP
jgi:hypothetical protein